MQRKKKKLLALILLTIISVTVLSIAHYIIFNKLKGAVLQKIETLNKSDYNIRYDSIHFHWLKNRILIDALVLEKDAYDTTCIHPEFISARKVQIEGFSLLSFLINKKLAFDLISFVDPHILIRKNTGLLPDSVSQGENKFKLTIDRLRFQSAHVAYSDTSCTVTTEVNTNITVTDLAVDLQPDKPVDIRWGMIQLDDTQLDLPEVFYTLLFQKIKYDYMANTFEIDTIKIKPHLSKLAFARKKPHETDRFEGVIPFLKLGGLRFRYQDTVSLSAINTDIQMYLKVFRDKRLPDKKQFTVLPIQQLQKLSFGLTIDTIRIIKSYIEYEEFADDAETSGSVHFDNLYATIYDINNDRSLKNGKTILDAQADFMGDGLLSIHSVLPWNTQSENIMTGSLKNFTMAKINSMLFPVANMKIESGKLKSIDFKYTYNMIRSMGEIELNYENLKLTSFKDEGKTKIKKDNDSDALQKDNLKSFIVNAFIIRKNMDEGVPAEKRTGEIVFERNTSRSIFNYWWKSVFSGIKSAYNLDNLQQRIEKKSAKKEQRKLDKKNKKK